MFTDDDLASGYVPLLLELIGESPGGLTLTNLPGVVRGRLKGRKPAKASFERKLERSMLISIAFGRTDIQTVGGIRVFLRRQDPARPAAGPAASPPTVTIINNPPAASPETSKLKSRMRGFAAGPASGTPGPAARTDLDSDAPIGVMQDYQGEILASLADKPKKPDDLKADILARAKSKKLIFDPDLYDSAFRVLKAAKRIVKNSNGEFAVA